MILVKSEVKSEPVVILDDIDLVIIPIHQLETDIE